MTNLARLPRLVPVLALAWVAFCPSALAQSGASAAQALFDEGRKAMDAQDYNTACDRFRESNRLDPGAGAVLNLARCEEARGKVATAWELYQRATGMLPASDERVEVARKRAEELASRLPKLVIQLRGASARNVSVKVDDVELGAASLGVPLPVDPGRHEVKVVAAGQAPRMFAVELAESEERVLDVAPGARGQDPGSAAVAAGGGSNKTLGYVLGGVGVVGLSVGAITGVMALSKKRTVDDNCDANKLCNQQGLDASESGKSLGTVSTVGLIVGAVGVGVGAYFILSSDPETGAQTTIQTAPTLGGAQASFLTTW